MTIDIEQMRKLAAEALAEHKLTTPGPWFWNGYSAVYSGPLTQTWDDPETPQYPESSRPGPPWFNEPGGEADAVWLEQKTAAYRVDPLVCLVPAHHGDTAIENHATDADWIAHAHEREPLLAAAVIDLADEAELERVSGGNWQRTAQATQQQLAEKQQIIKHDAMVIEAAQQRIAELEAAIKQHLLAEHGSAVAPLPYTLTDDERKEAGTRWRSGPEPIYVAFGRWGQLGWIK